VRGEPPDLGRDVRRDGGDEVVVVRFDSHHPRTHRGAEAHREDRAERDRHLAEDVAGVAHADHPLDPVGALDRLDAPVEHGEQRPLTALRRRVLTRFQGDVGYDARELLALGPRERGEKRNPLDLLRGDHRPTLSRDRPRVASRRRFRRWTRPR
jgi:hypothetical protein